MPGTEDYVGPVAHRPDVATFARRLSGLTDVPEREAADALATLAEGVLVLGGEIHVIVVIPERRLVTTIVTDQSTTALD